MTMTAMSQPPPGRPRSASGSSGAQEIVAILRSTPFYRWATFREQVDAAHRRTFDDACALVRGEWDADELRSQVRQALTTAAAEIILAMPDLLSGRSDHESHLRAGRAALRAAEELAAVLRTVVSDGF